MDLNDKEFIDMVINRYIAKQLDEGVDSSDIDKDPQSALAAYARIGLGNILRGFGIEGEDDINAT